MNQDFTTNYQSNCFYYFKEPTGSHFSSPTNDKSACKFSIQENDTDYLSKLYNSNKSISLLEDPVDEVDDSKYDFHYDDTNYNFSRADQITFKFDSPVSMGVTNNRYHVTGVIQNSNQELNEAKTKNVSHEEDKEAHNAKSVSDKEMDSVSASNSRVNLNTSSQNSNCQSSTRKIRRDVVNKTLFRIIRRFFHSVLIKLVPDYKSQKRENLMSMLVSFSEYLFPGLSDYNEIAHVLSALMFRREMLLSKISTNLKDKIQVFLDIQSKYTHRLIAQAIDNRYFRVVFKYFLENGIEFFNNDENVINHFSQYHQELDKIKDVYFKTS